MMEPMLHAPKAGQKINLEIRHYGKAEGRYFLYDDDGETFDYKKGIFSWREINVIYDEKDRLKGIISKAEKGKPDNIAKVTWKFMTAKYGISDDGRSGSSENDSRCSGY